MFHILPLHLNNVILVITFILHLIIFTILIQVNSLILFMMISFRAQA